MNAQQLTVRQAKMWLILLQIGSAILQIPRALTMSAKKDAWLSVVLALTFIALLVPVYGTIANRLQKSSFSEYIVGLFGRVGGKAVLLLYLLGHPYLIFTLVLRIFSDFLTITLIPETPPEAILILEIAAVVYIVRCGVQVIGRSAEILFFFVLTLFALGYASLLPSAEWSNLTPVLEQGAMPVLTTSFMLLTYPYTDSMMAFLFMTPFLSQAQKWKSTFLKSSIASGCILLLVTILTICVLSDGVVANLLYPSYFAVRTISIGEFFERFEVLIAVLWFISIFYYMSYYLHTTVHGIAAVFNLREPQSLLIPLSLLALLTSGIVWPSTPVDLSVQKIWPIYSPIFGILLPLVIWLVGCFKKQKAPEGAV